MAIKPVQSVAKTLLPYAPGWPSIEWSNEDKTTHTPDRDARVDWGAAVAVSGSNPSAVTGDAPAELDDDWDDREYATGDDDHDDREEDDRDDDEQGDDLDNDDRDDRDDDREDDTGDDRNED